MSDRPVGNGHDRGDAAAEPPTAEEPLVEPVPDAAELRPYRRNVLADLDWVSLLYVGLGMLVAWAVFGLFRVAGDGLTVVGVGIVLALAFDPVVRALQGRLGWRRGAAVAVVCSGLLLAFAAVFVLLGPPAARQAAGFGQELPETVGDLYRLPIVGGRLREAEVADEVNQWVADLPGRISTETISAWAEDVAGGLASALQVLLVTFAVLLDGELIVGRVRRLIPPRHRARADWIGRTVHRTLGRYFAGSLVLAVMNGIYILAVGLALGVPLAFVAAIWAMLTNLIPQIGGFLGGSVFVTLALTSGIGTGLLALALFLLYMTTENYLIQPVVVGRVINLSPPTTMLAAFVGAAAAGIPGALVTTPLVAAVKELSLELRFGPEPDERKRTPRLPGLGAVRRLRSHLTRRLRADV